MNIGTRLEMHRPPRILHIITGLSTGGAERALYNGLAGGLASEFESTVISLRDRGSFADRIEALGVPVHALGIRAGVSPLKALRKLRQLTRDIKPALIQGWMYQGNLAANLARAVAIDRPILVWNIRHSLHALSYEKKTIQWSIVASKRLSSKPEAIIYNSAVSRKQHADFGFAAACSQVVPNGFDLANWHSSTLLKAKMRQVLGIPDCAFVVGHVARFHPMKDHSGFLCAAVHLANEVPEAHFLIAGRDVSPSNPALDDIIPSMLMSRFHFLGERVDVQDIFRAMDLFCTSSAWGESFPNVIGEAMATGLPCVVTDIGDSAYIVDDTGWVVQPQDGKALGDAMHAAFSASRDGEAWAARCEATRHRVEVNFSLEKTVAIYSKLWNQLLDR